MRRAGHVHYGRAGSQFLLKHNAVSGGAIWSSAPCKIKYMSFPGAPPCLKRRRLCSCLFYRTGLWITRSVQDFPHPSGIRLIGHEIFHLGENFRFRRRRVEYDLQRAGGLGLRLDFSTAAIRMTLRTSSGCDAASMRATRFPKSLPADERD